MAVHALVSAGGSPGVTTAALALTLTWPGPAMLAECDPSGGDIMAGLLAGQAPGQLGILHLAAAAGGGPGVLTATLADQLVTLDQHQDRTLLPGIADPRQARSLGPSWPAIASLLAGQDCDVIADCGRLDDADRQPLPVLEVAAGVALVVRPTLRQVARASSRVAQLAELLGGTSRLRLLVTGPGSYQPREIAEQLGLAVAGVLPGDTRTAGLLSDGQGRRSGLAARPLIRSARAAARTWRQAAPAPALGARR